LIIYVLSFHEIVLTGEISKDNHQDIVSLQLLFTGSTLKNLRTIKGKIINKFVYFSIY